VQPDAVYMHGQSLHLHVWTDNCVVGRGCGREQGPSRQARCGAQVYKDMVERSLRGGSRSGKGGSSVGGRSAGAPDDTAHGPDHAKAALGQSGAAHAGAPAKPAAV